MVKTLNYILSLGIVLLGLYHGYNGNTLDAISCYAFVAAINTTQFINPFKE